MLSLSDASRRDGVIPSTKLNQRSLAVTTRSKARRRHPSLMLIGLAAMIVAVGAKASEMVTYTYDARGRLTATAHSGSVNNGVGSSYTFDHADNRIAHAITGGASASVADASFESPNVGTSYAYQPSASGAAFISNAGVTGNNVAWNFTAPDGNQVAFLQVNGSYPATITLDVTSLAPGASYVIRFKAATRPGYSPVAVHVFFDSTNLGTYTPGSTTFQTMVSTPFQATASAGTVTLQGDLGTVDRATGVDAVEIIRTS